MKPLPKIRFQPSSLGGTCLHSTTTGNQIDIVVPGAAEKAFKLAQHIGSHVAYFAYYHGVFLRERIRFKPGANGELPASLHGRPVPE